jgi:hypothetical protein
VTDAIDTLSLSKFAVSYFEQTYRTVLDALNGLPNADLHRQPSPDTNSIGWLAWHLYRWQDQLAARAAGLPQVWHADRWHERFGVEAERTGQGDSLEQVAAFRPAREVLLAYIEAVHDAVADRIGSLPPQRFAESVAYADGRPPRPLWRSLAATMSDTGQHTGQIAYLRGLFSGYGWRG